MIVLSLGRILDWFVYVYTIGKLEVKEDEKKNVQEENCVAGTRVMWLYFRNFILFQIFVLASVSNRLRSM